MLKLHLKKSCKFFSIELTGKKETLIDLLVEDITEKSLALQQIGCCSPSKILPLEKELQQRLGKLVETIEQEDEIFFGIQRDYDLINENGHK